MHKFDYMWITGMIRSEYIVVIKLLIKYLLVLYENDNLNSIINKQICNDYIYIYLANYWNSFPFIIWRNVNLDINNYVVHYKHFIEIGDNLISKELLNLGINYGNINKIISTIVIWCLQNSLKLPLKFI